MARILGRVFVAALLLRTIVFAQSSASSSVDSTSSSTPSGSRSASSNTGPTLAGGFSGQTVTTSIAPPSGPYTSYSSTLLATSTTSLSNSTRSNSLNLVGSTSANNATVSATNSSTAALPSNTQPCNGYPEFCSRKYMNITEVCAHNSAFVVPNNAASNQAIIVLGQLNDGIRMIQGETHWVNDTIYSCHTNCDLLNAGTLQQELTTVREWVDEHPYDVVTILLVNSDFRNVTDYVAPIQGSGLGPYLYEPPKIPMGLDDWPTLSQMLLTRKRVVVFMDYMANQTQVPYVLDEFSQMWETPFSPQDPQFPCTQQRPPNLSRESAEGLPYLMNHNLNIGIDLGGSTGSILIPNFAELNQTNSIDGLPGQGSTGALGVAANNCTASWNRPPAFLLVDFYNDGNFPGSVFEVAAQMNGVNYTGSCCGQSLGINAAQQNKSNLGLIVTLVMAMSIFITC